MDLSKLPKLSNTAASQPQGSGSDAAPAAPADPIRLDYSPTRPAGIGADIWFNTVVGLLLIGLGFHFGKFLVCKLSGTPYHTGVNWVSGPNEGKEVGYPELEGFVMYTDGGMFCFGATVLLEAIVKAVYYIRGRAPIIAIGAVLLLAAVSTLFNLYACMLLFGAGLIPILSGLAVAFGGYIVTDLLRLMKLSLPRVPAQ